MTVMEDVPSGFKGSDEDAMTYETYDGDDEPIFIPDEEPCLYFTYSQLNDLLYSKFGFRITMYSWITMEPVNGQVCFEGLHKLNDYLMWWSARIGQGAPNSVLTNTECNRIRSTYWQHNRPATQAPTTSLFLMSNGTWQENVMNPEDDTGIQMAVPLGMSAAAPILSKVLVKKIQKKWRSTHQLQEIVGFEAPIRLTDLEQSLFVN